MSDLIRALARNMVLRKKSEAESYILLIGAGASITSGCSSMRKIINDVLRSHEEKKFNDCQAEIREAYSVNQEYGDLLTIKIDNEKSALFYDVWNRLDKNTRYSILKEHLWINNEPSEGYKYLAYLVKKGYIKIILSTNLDNLLEKLLKM